VLETRCSKHRRGYQVFSKGDVVYGEKGGSDKKIFEWMENVERVD
jgi:hypothetical protein